MDRPPSSLTIVGLCFLSIAISLSGCVGRATTQSPGPGAERPSLSDVSVIAEDGYRLPIHHWHAIGEPRAIVLGVHGFNDYGASFDILAESLVAHGIDVYAYDQRGFGTTKQRRLWPGEMRLSDDVSLLARLLRERHPDVPLYLVGKSMGAAVIILAMTDDDPPPVDGSVLISPAMWGLSGMPWYQRLSMWLGIRLIPSYAFTSRMVQRLGIEPTDDPEIMKRMAEDPLLLRSARVDTLHGLVLMMDNALEATKKLPGPALILYGEEDHIIPDEAICAMLERQPNHEETPWRMALYPDGYHMLTRYTQRELTHNDIASWLLDPATPLPSGDEVSAGEARQALCR